MLKKYLIAFFISMVPLIELRGGVPYAVLMGLDYWPSLVICAIGKCRMLVLHVFDLNGHKRAEADCLLQHLTGVIGMNVQLDQILGIDEDHAVADAADKLAELTCSVLASVRLLLFDDAFGTICKTDILGVKLAEICLCLRFLHSGALKQRNGIALEI